MTAACSEGLGWFSSSYSNNGGNCVEVTADLVTTAGTVPIRDSKAPADAVLTLPAGAFAAFVAGLRESGLTR
ncbi:DUF397 domain-containing protein [Streptomyces bohaiensis]|uniref:DUF397 domain-containing protein n=1 Tax=Streptomyces bohaiensis TaxID=1431344 RepID=A0ABX1CGX7_9ACTN|nr:DUF397 domain-containing protein [Streptomyces bohaiensis]NJQ15694.1 DUF397 domain-containing protein [Streptomyces bohaiensis]